MEAEQGLGSVGTVTESLSGGVVKIDVAVQENIVNDLTAIAAKLPDGWEKTLLNLVIGALSKVA